MAYQTNGLLTPVGIIILYLLYVTYFLVSDAFVAKYRPTLISQALFNFAIYSVFITGFLHAELLNFLKPHEIVIITLIRIQSALFLVFVMPIVDRLTKRDSKSPGLKQALFLFFLFVLLITPSKMFGLVAAFHTVRAAPVLSICFIILSAAALYVATRKIRDKYESPSAGFSVLLSVIALVPNIFFFLVYAPVMIVCFVISLHRRKQIPAR